jgi:hypothetical protein
MFFYKISLITYQKKIKGGQLYKNFAVVMLLRFVT